MSSRWVQTRLGSARPRFKELKYKLLGIPAPDSVRHQYVPPSTWEDTDTLQYLKQTRVLAQSAIALLVRATDINAKITSLPSIRASLRQPRGIDNLLKADAKFEKSLSQLTAYDYGAKYTERITNFLVYMLRPGNSLELTTEMYNKAIGYFLAINDIHMAHLLLHQMQLRRISPDTTTMNQFFASQARRITANPYPLEQLGHPLLMTVSLLRKMSRLNIKANAATWNLVLQCMPFGFGKSFLVEEMDRREIPLSAESQQVCLETMISEHKSGRKSGASPRIYEAVLGSLDLKNPAVKRLIIERILSQKQPNNANVKRALGLLHSVAPEDTTTQTLNVFLRRFAERKHFDWQLGVLGYFKQTAWDPETWQHLIQAASLMFYNRPERYVVIGTLLKQAEREDVPLTPRARVCARRSLRVAAQRGCKLLDLGPAGWESLKTNLQWTVGTMEPQNTSYLRYIGFQPNYPDSRPGEYIEHPTSPQADNLMQTASDMKAETADLDLSRFEALPWTNAPPRIKALHAALKQSRPLAQEHVISTI